MKTTPFKSPEKFEEEIKNFANRYRTIVEEHAERISDYFEISCYNRIVEYYAGLGYELSVKNLQAGRFRYKCSPAGHLHNFSFFSASKEGEKTFYIFHNATVQSFYSNDVYTTPDIVVAYTQTPEFTDCYYETRLKMSYLKNADVITFFESKHLTPFPELIINFVGTVNELKPDCLKNEPNVSLFNHLAPSLLMSGVAGKPCIKIKQSLEDRYFVNILDNMMDSSSSSVLSSMNVMHLTTYDSKRK